MEMNDPSFHPVIAGVVDMEQYDVVFVGFSKMEYGSNCVLCI